VTFTLPSHFVIAGCPQPSHAPDRLSHFRSPGVAQAASSCPVNGVAHAYQRSNLLERRRPVMNAWPISSTGRLAAKVVAIGAARGNRK
jgi:hypothetical protein